VTFDGASKRIILSTSSTSASEIWSEYIRWLAISTDNDKWVQAMTQVGGDDLGGGIYIPIYIFLQNGWRVRPMESNHSLQITGNLFVAGGGNPLVNTLGTYNVLTTVTVPVQAQAMAVSGGSGGGATAAEVWEYVTRTLTEAPGLQADERTKLMSLDTTNLDVAVSTRATAADVTVTVNPTAVTVNPTLTAEEHTKLMGTGTGEEVATAVWSRVLP